MTSGNQGVDSLRVTLEVLVKFGVHSCSGEVHLLIHLGAEAWQEGFELGGQQIHGLDGCVDDLFASFWVGFCESPRSCILHVGIAERREGHRHSEGILNFNIFHKLKEFLKLGIN